MIQGQEYAAASSVNSLVDKFFSCFRFVLSVELIRWYFIQFHTKCVVKLDNALRLESCQNGNYLLFGHNNLKVKR